MFLSSCLSIQMVIVF